MTNLALSHDLISEYSYETLFGADSLGASIVARSFLFESIIKDDDGEYTLLTFY